jgi:thiamine pyrophosphokinase
LGTCVIFNAGDFDGLIEPIGPEDHLLAADGGLKHMTRLGLTPHGILGDFDSLGYVPENASVFPAEKDDTDAMLAIRHGLKLGYRRFILYGSLDGPRLDHTVANFQALQFLADQGAQGWLVGRSYVATVLKNGSLYFAGRPQGILSVFCMGPDAGGVTLKGLKYPLENGVLTAGFPLGVSNHFTGRDASVSVEAGSLLILYDRANGLPVNPQDGR